MKRNILFIFFAVCSMMLCAQEEAAGGGLKGKGKVYMFGVSQQLTDTVIYVTSISEVDSIDLEKKTSFLPFRTYFSSQLEDYVSANLSKKKQTAAVFYSTKRSKLAKKLYKVKKYYLDNANNRLVVIDDSKFKFVHPLDLVKE